MSLRHLLLVIVFLLNSFMLSGQEVTVVLSGGGAKAFSHIGVLKALEQNDVPIDQIVGTSMGALIGGLYAAGYSPDQIQTLLSNPYFADINRLRVNDKVAYYQHYEPNASFISLPFYINNGLRVELPFRVFDLQDVDYYLMQAFSHAASAASCSYDSLMIPFRCVSSDIDSAKIVVMSQGDIAKAIRTSMTFPLLIRPVEIDGQLLFDGGMYDNFPVEVAREAFNPDLIIGSKAVRNFSRANPDNLVSLLQNMLMQKANFNIDTTSGVLIETVTGDEDIFHFGRIEEYVDSGYVAAIRMIPDIKNKLQHGHTGLSVKEKRQEYLKRHMFDSINEVRFEGVNGQQQQYFSRILGLKPGRRLTMESLDKYFRRIQRNENVKSVYPVLASDGTDTKKPVTDLILEMKLEDPLRADLGLYISSSGVNEAYVGLGYMHLGKTAKHVNLSAQFGTFYNSVAAMGRVEFPGRIPAILQINMLTSRKNYFSNARYFFEDDFPAYIIVDENYAELSLGLPSGLDAAFNVGLSNLNINFIYYQNNYFSRSDTADISNFYFAVPFFEYEYNTLNKKDYANGGRLFYAGLNAYFGNEHTTPGSISQGQVEVRTNRQFYDLRLRYKDYFQIASPLVLKVSADLTLSNRPLLNNYVASLLLSTQFEPEDFMQTLFLQNYRSPSYGGFGLSGIIKLGRPFDLRISGYSFVPYQKILVSADGLQPTLSDPFNYAYFAASTQLVFHPPIGVISASVNYVDQPGNKFGFLINLGYLIFNKSRLYR